MSAIAWEKQGGRAIHIHIADAPDAGEGSGRRWRSAKSAAGVSHRGGKLCLRSQITACSTYVSCAVRASRTEPRFAGVGLLETDKFPAVATKMLFTRIYTHLDIMRSRNLDKGQFCAALTFYVSPFCTGALGVLALLIPVTAIESISFVRAQGANQRMYWLRGGPPPHRSQSVQVRLLRAN